MYMNEKTQAKVYYTPLQNPESVKLIEIKNENDFEMINNFVKGIISKN